MCNDEEMTDKLVVLTPEDIFDLGRAINVATVAGTSRLSPERSAQLQQALAAAVPAGPRYLLVARDSSSDALEIETYETREELVAAVTGYALSYYDDLCAYDRGVAIPDVEDLPEVRAAVEQQREAQRQRDLVSGREWRQREYLRLKAEFEPATTSKSEGA